MEKKSETNKLSSSFKVGAISFAFLIIGYQAALFIRSAAVAHLESNRDKPDTVFVVSSVPEESVMQPVQDGQSTPRNKTVVTRSERHEAQHSRMADAIVEKSPTKQVENFSFDPNTVSIHDLKRLGFSEKQAESIDRYRSSGGRFRRPEDFAKSYVVADSVFDRLKPFIHIPKTNLNTADSTAFDALPGIGPYFASKMVNYREQLGGYSYPEQLMDIYHFDEEKFDGLKDLIEVGTSAPFPLWTASEEELAGHPYISKHAAHGIVIFRENSPQAQWTVAALKKAGILDAEDAGKLSRCRIAAP